MRERRDLQVFYASDCLWQSLPIMALLLGEWGVGVTVVFVTHIVFPLTLRSRIRVPVLGMLGLPLRSSGVAVQVRAGAGMWDDCGRATRTPTARPYGRGDDRPPPAPRPCERCGFAPRV